MEERHPPYDVLAEEAVLGAILLDESALNACTVARLSPVDFYREQNGWIYAAAEECMAGGMSVTIPTVAHIMEALGTLDKAGGEPYLAELAGRHFTAIGVEAHIRIVQQCARYRRMIAAAGRIAQIAYEGGPDDTRVMNQVLDLVHGLVTDRDTGLERLGFGGIDDPPGKPWGIPVMDRYTMGRRPGELIIIAGGVGEGKSMLAAQIARLAAEGGDRVAMWTTEMSNHRYELRMAHAIAAVRSVDSLYAPPLTESERERLSAAMDRVSQLDIRASAAPGISADIISAAVRADGADLVVVDYLQMLSMPRSDTEAGALKSTTKRLKQLSVEAGATVVLASQMNRAAQAEMRGKDSEKMRCVLTGETFPRPFMQALMGGAVEADADLVIMLQRHTGEACLAARHMEVFIVKNRNGRTGSGMMFDDFSLCRFTSYTEAECYSAAKGDTGLAHRLLRDQGWRTEDYQPVETADGWIGV